MSPYGKAVDDEVVPPADPHSNKAVVAALAFVAALVERYLQDKSFDLSEEGILGLIGALGTLGVYAISNWRKVFPGA